MAGIRFIQRNGIALLALFIALGGTTYAASTAFPRNSVGAKQLKKNAVTRSKIKNNAINGARIANGSVTGLDILESSLSQVPSAGHADTATIANHATTATNATNATHADTATNADDADKLGGIAASGWQKRVTGSCDFTKAISAIAADGSITCASPVFLLSFDVASSGVNDPADALPFLHIGAGCDLPATFVAFVNTGPTDATLNYIYADKSGAVTATGLVLPATNGEKDIGFADNDRIEGQFVFANGNGVTTVNLHAFDAPGAGGCEIRGTIEFGG